MSNTEHQEQGLAYFVYIQITVSMRISSVLIGSFQNEKNLLVNQVYFALFHQN